ncbi:M4 family metallopeptidase, partial [Pseudomonadales bacterium]|nr:M4 family metallopeptidase [Pseudomonadales bacterium]
NGNDVRVLVTENGIKSVLGQFEFIDPGFDVSGNIPNVELTAIASNIDGYEDFAADPSTAEPQIIFAGGLPAFVTSIRAEDPRGRKIEAFVDPRSKVVVKVEENFYDVQVATSAQDLKDNTVDFHAEDAGPTSYMINKTISGVSDWTVAVNEFERADADYWYWNMVSSQQNSGPWKKSAVSAMSGVLQTLNYFSATHGLLGTGSKSKQVAVVTDFRDGSEDNAFWFSDTIALGVGNSWNNVAGSVDVIAHEISHGVVENSAGLRYQNQSGALNESFADIFGAMVDREDWLMGEDLGTPIRSFSNPPDYGQPGHMDDFRKSPNTQAGDWGGVHVNSGIPNRAFYLLAEGLTEESLGASIGKEKAEKLAYTTLTNLTRDSDFITAASLMLTTSNVKYGEDSAESLAVVAAWKNVGISLASDSEDTDSPVGERKKTYKWEAGDDLLIALYPRDGYIYDPRDDTFDLYAVKACISSYCYGTGYDSRYPENDRLSVIESTRTAALNDVPVARGIPSAARVEEGYTWIAYVGTDGDVYLSPVVYFDFTPIKFDMPERIARVALSRDYTRFAFVLENSNDIYIYSFAKESWTIYPVTGRSYSSAIEGEDVRRVDSLSFSVDSDQVVFDYEVCRPSIDPDQECDLVWSIGLLDVDKGFEYPLPSQSSDVDLGFPRLSYIGGERIVYQAWDYSDGSLKAQVWLYDYFLRKSENFVNYGWLSESQMFKFGFPDFFPQDKGITFTGFGKVDFYSLDSNFEDNERYLGGRNFESKSSLGGFVHRATYLNVQSEAKLSTEVYDFGNLIKGSKVSRSLSFENSGNQELEVFSVSGSKGLSASLDNVRISAAKSAAFTITLDTGKVALGAYGGSVEILSTADRGSGTISVKAFIDIDSDGDGIGNAVDPDDDNDGVKDFRDAYPLISLGGLADFDSDGRPNDCDAQCQALGMSADLDDDDDSMPDLLEIANGLNPLDGADCPRWYCTKLSPAILAIASSSFDFDKD